ncbi:dynein axonemal assembly factor 8 isoform X1 [Meriones unguiculatus]|uniref:dynein axonemal assembly factor 8 isoform X1 n=1 Tax=Meriones unguiculatus TaxID=10047 RepID=UPI000B4FB55D|nr:dynein axonemal assembly factor 8 isoform X1 [Meriones unguiculatus]XP_060220084.1 dynein axonemal assembly factor 8 isoform X1 [Meriones unguiculatus]XP_060220085.1 dynein axonemal assembly factor 8 isoform X1 [Meriones unguiculatus]
MTSKEKAMVSLPVSPWDAILKAAKDQLPSLDSDSSSSDGEEEEPFIFQRNQPLLIPDLAEELAEDSIGVDESGIWFAVGSSSPEPLLVPERLAIEPRREQEVRQKDVAALERRVSGWSCQSCVKSSPIVVDAEEVLPWLEGNLRSLPNPKGSQSPPWPSQGKEATFPLEGELKTEHSNMDFRNSAKRRALRKERRKMIERDILQKVTQAAPSPASGDQRQAAKSGPWPEATSEQSQEGRPVLSLKYLEGWDLDYILQSLPGRQDSQGDSEPRTAWWLADRWQDQGHTAALSQDTLLEQLALLCATQSRGRKPTWKLSADKLQDTEEQKARSRSASAEHGFQTESVQKLAERRLKAEPSTIFIDLRQTGPSETQQQSQESSEYSSSDSEEEEVETAGSVQAASSREQRDCTGKSQLLQQLRAFRKGAIPPQLSASASPGGQKVQATEDTAGSHTGVKKHVKLWAEKRNALDVGDPLGK